MQSSIRTDAAVLIARKRANSFKERHHDLRHCHRRSGATTVEGAIVLILMLSVMFSLLDLGLLVFQSNLLSLAARRLAREAIVRGAAADSASEWGPMQIVGTATDGSPAAQVISPYAVTMTRSKLTFQMTWPDGTNLADDRVIAHLTYTRNPMTPLTKWMGAIRLNADATLRVVH